jgi:DNA polymerase-3 subunit epsilon
VNGACQGACEQREDAGAYNDRVHKAIASLSEEPSYAIIDRGLQKEDQSCILVLNGKLYGMGYIPLDAQVMNVDGIKDYLKPYKENSMIRNLLLGYKAKNPNRIFDLNRSI